MTEVAGEFQGFSLHEDTLNPVLRAWNQLNTIYNIKEILRNNSVAVNYTKKLSRIDQLGLVKMAMTVSKNGYENTRRTIMKDNNIV